ncbi:NACHT domain-containing protein [Micromonospora sp. NPDC049274]|uniref:NACHT domain-containing protein n=1 Tax=Micromonospora sp. NPDC049274 TaxID=3154829 RepID=UPI00341B38B9
MSRRLSVAHRPGAAGGRGGEPPTGLAALHRAERGALIQNSSKSAVEAGQVRLPRGLAALGQDVSVRPIPQMRNRIIVSALAVPAVASLMWLLLKQGLDRADQIASVGALLIATITLVATFGPSLLGHKSGEDDLAKTLQVLAESVAEQWSGEEQLRKLHDPEPLPVQWHAVGPPVSDYWGNIRTDGKQHPLAVDGRLGGIAEVFLKRLHRQRLVILGDAGSGKTVIATRLLLDLVKNRDELAPVPVLLTLATWDPKRQDLNGWISGQLAVDYPAMHQKGRVERLLKAGGILPILDGLDEMPHENRALAIASINHLGTSCSMVLTSRPQEYRDTVRNSDVVTAAAVIELEHLAATTVCAYLRRSTHPRLEANWERVFKRMTQRPQGALARALSTPLMVSLARTNYAHADANPSALLGSDLKSQERISSHLIESLIPSVFPGPPLDSGCTSKEANKWLLFLAHYLRERDSLEISWWRLHEAAEKATGWTYFAIMGIIAGVFYVIENFGLAVIYFIATMGSSALFAFRVLEHPSIVAVNFKRFPRPFAKVFAGMTCLGILKLPVMPDFLVVWIYSLMGLVTGAVVGLNKSLTAPVDAARASSPIATLRAERKVCLVSAILVGLALGIGLGFFGGPVVGGARGFAAGFLGGLTSALSGHWGTFLLARLVFAARGMLPIRLMSFLDDAHRRGVLRQAGARYQFRHVLLQEYLVPSLDSPIPEQSVDCYTEPRYKRLVLRSFSAFAGTLLAIPAVYVASSSSEQFMPDIPQLTAMIFAPLLVIVIPVHILVTWIILRNRTTVTIWSVLRVLVLMLFSISMVSIASVESFGLVWSILVSLSYAAGILMIGFAVRVRRRVTVHPLIRASPGSGESLELSEPSS